MRRVAAVCAIVLACGAPTGCGGASRHAVITVTPTSALADRARSITISGLAPGQLVIVTAVSPRPDGTWAASASFRVPRSGAVDLGKVAPVLGSYRGVSPMGLFWSQHLLSAGSGAPARSSVTTLTVSAGPRILATTRVTQQFLPSSLTVRSTGVADHGFAGQYFGAAGRDPPRGPAVILWGGSEGGFGDTPNRAALLAAHGIPALALAYFDEPGLPCSLEDIPLEYFVRAIEWLRTQPDVDPDRIWVETGARGTEAALLLAARWPSLVHGVIAASPRAVIGGSNTGDCATRGGVAWTLGGAPLAAGQPIPLSTVRGPVMLVTGGDDQLEASASDAEQITAALAADRAAHVHLHYPRAGPAVLGIPYAPIATAQLEYGGTAAADSAAYASDWPATIAFIEQH